MFVGRKEELEDLETLWRKRTSSIVACCGRRRIGGYFDAVVPAAKLLKG